MNEKQESLARATYQDLRKTYPSMTWDFVRAAAEKVAAGEKPTNIAGIFVEGNFKRAGLLPAKE